MNKLKFQVLMRSEAKIFVLAGMLLWWPVSYSLRRLFNGVNAGQVMVKPLHSISMVISTTGGIGKVQGVLLRVVIFELLKADTTVPLLVLAQYDLWFKGIVIVVSVGLDIR